MKGEEPLNLSHFARTHPELLVRDYPPKLWKQKNSSFPCFQRRKRLSPELCEDKDCESLHPEP